MIVGELRIDGVVDGGGRFRPDKTFRGTSPEVWQAHRDLLDDEGMLAMTLGGYLVRGLGRTVLIDAGLGPGRLMGFEGGAMLDNLAAVGVQPGEITDVIFTHLHIDHIGWATQRGAVTFPNATYRCSQADWQHFMVEHRDVPDAYPGAEGIPVNPHAALVGATKLFDTYDGSGTILPGVDIIAAPGHTPGSSVVVLSSGTNRAMLLGDVVHCPVQLIETEWDGIMDVDPALARRTREALARELEGADVPVAAAHFPDLRFGRLLAAEGTRRFVF
jgi:glyoxylase-like metal-dependent hydrolase (beta-lactamase superfamily II)